MTEFQLAQVNIAAMRAPLESPTMAEFVANLDRINALAEGSPGFIWRLQTPAGDATSIRVFDDDQVIVNMSVWQDVESLKRYVYQSAHVEVMRRRKEWFEHMSEAFLVLWWVRKGHEPSVSEAVSKLRLLRQHGATSDAFTFRQLYPPPDVQASQATTGALTAFDDVCPAT